MGNMKKALCQHLKKHITSKEEVKIWENEYGRKIYSGTRKIYCIILKEILKSRQSEYISIIFDEYSDSLEKVCFLYSISINGKSFALDKTYFDSSLLQKYLSLYDFKYGTENFQTMKVTALSLEKINATYLDKQETITTKQARFIGYRSKVCDYLIENSIDDDIKTMIKKF